MNNQSMQRKLQSGHCLDVNKEGVMIDLDVYLLRRFIENVDYCDAVAEEWIWSIGRRRSDGAIFASTDTRFYQHPDFECLFLR